MELREKLIALRKKKGMSQLEVAEELTVSRQAVSKWEVGDTLPSTSNLSCLAKLYGVTLEYLTNNDLNEISTENENKKDTPEKISVREEHPPNTQVVISHKQFWKKLAICLLALCAILAAILFYTKFSEKPGDSQDSIPIGELEVKSVQIPPDAGFNLEW